MIIDEKRIDKMKKLVEGAKKANTIIPSEKAFEAYPPEGIWEKDANGTATVKELNSV